MACNDHVLEMIAKVLHGSLYTLIMLPWLSSQATETSVAAVVSALSPTKSHILKLVL